MHFHRMLECKRSYVSIGSRFGDQNAIARRGRTEFKNPSQFRVADRVVDYKWEVGTRPLGISGVR